ncbi:MAG TPA: potassium channel family protein [Verrucomicrobiae bacterium]|nr:potassium channel family protein [Verrucomicrobiae bacterium]
MKNIFIGQCGGDLIKIQGYKESWFVVKELWDKPTFGIVRIVRLTLSLLAFLSLTVLIDQLFEWLFWSHKGSRSDKRERYAIAIPREALYILRFLGIALMLFTWTHKRGWECWICAYFIADIVLALAAGVFAWGQYSINPLRSFLLSLLNYAEVTMAFAIIYLNCDALRVTVTPGFNVKVMDALYFSVVTATTVGYGDIVTKQEYHLIAVLQLTVFVLFALVFLNALATRLSLDKNEDERLKEVQNKIMEMAKAMAELPPDKRDKIKELVDKLISP